MAVELHLRSNDEWLPTLRIPRNSFQLYTTRPLKWLRFLGYTLYGRKGFLTTIIGGEPVVDDIEDPFTVDPPPWIYYYHSDEAPRFVDPFALDDRTSVGHSSLQNSGNQTAFRTKLIERDRSCILTDQSPIICAACHLIPHAKGDNYIENFYKYRGSAKESEESGGSDDSEDTETLGNSAGLLNDIFDIRNGFLLTTALHEVFGRGDAAFIKTPNFAMTIQDIPPSPPANLPRVTDVPDQRLTVHHIADEVPGLISLIVPQNVDAWQPVDLSDWPPALILDYLYGCASIKRWGVPEVIKLLNSQVHDAYYDDNGVGDAEGDGEADKEEKEVKDVKKSDADREEGLKRRNAAKENPLHDIMDIVKFMWLRGSTRSVDHGQRPDSGYSNNERIEGWRRTVLDDSVVVLEAE